MPLTTFEPRSSGFRSNHSTNLHTLSTTALNQVFFQSTNEIWLHLAIGLESGDIKEFEFSVNKKKLFDADAVVKNDAVTSKTRPSFLKRLTSIFFYKTAGLAMPAVGYGGQGGCKFGANEDIWFTCSASIKNLHFFGDVHGKIHLFETPDATNVERRYNEEVHASSVVAASIVSVENVILLATASADGYVRLWKVEASQDAKISQIGEFFGRGIPFVSMTAVVTKNKNYSKGSDQVNVFVSDEKGVYVLDLHFI